MRRRLHGLMLLAATALAALGGAAPAQAAYPGGKGTVLVAAAVFDQPAVRGLFRVDVATGVAVPVAGTDGQDLDSVATSPDGKRLVVAFNDRLETMAADGSGRAVVPNVGSSTQPRARGAVFLADGRIAFITTGIPGNVFAIAPDGTGLVSLVTVRPGEVAPAYLTDLHVSPDGSTLFYQDLRAGSGDTGQIVKLEVATGFREDLTRFEGPGKRITLGDVSPDGNLLVFTEQVNNELNGTERIHRQQIKVLDLRQRTFRGIPTQAELPQKPRFSPDGSSIVFAAYREQFAIGNPPPAPMPIHVMNVDGTGERVAYTFPAQAFVHDVRWEAAGVPVSGQVQKKACGATSCRLPEGLPGVTLTATRAGVAPVTAVTGADGRYVLGLDTGAWTVTPSLRDAAFDPETRAVTVVDTPVTEVDFETCGPSPQDGEAAPAPPTAAGFRSLREITSCPLDYVVDAIEVVQRVQGPTWFTDGGTVNVTDEGPTPSGRYITTGGPHVEASRLVRGVSTIVKVYVRVTPGHEGTKPPPAKAIAIAGSRRVELTPIKTPKALDSNSGLKTRRDDLGDVYAYALPPSILDEVSFQLFAEITPDRKKECKTRNGKSCLDNNRWLLTGLKPVATRPWEVSLFRFRYATSNGAGADIRTTAPTAVEQRLEGNVHFLPLRDRDLRVTRVDRAVDSTGAVAWAQRKLTQLGHPTAETGLIEDCLGTVDCPDLMIDGLMQRLKAAVRAQARPTPHPLVVYPYDLHAGTTGATPLPGLDVSVSDLDVETQVHELMHQKPEIVNHASDSSGCLIGDTEPAAFPEPWPDTSGTIVGVGVHPKRGWASLLPYKWFDVMSYCLFKLDETWIAPAHWNRLVDTWRVGKGTRSAAATGPSLAATPGLQVLAVLGPGGTEPDILASPVQAVATPSDPAGTIVVTAYDAAGAVTAQVRAVDGSPQRSGTVDVVLPITEAARIELLRDRGTPSVAVRSASAPTVALQSLRTGGRVAAGKGVRLAWTMADADPADRLSATVAYSADDGRTWTALVVGATGSSVTLAPGALTRSTRGRLRVTVSDGLREISVTSGRLRVEGRPPALTLITKGTLRTTKGAPLRLAGYAYDEIGTALRGARLRWLQGRKLLGRGEAVTVRFATKGARTITLRATDRFGRSTSSTVRVVVR